jgi:hypothetical protein
VEDLKPGEMRERAVALAERGFRVFRLQPGRRDPLPGVSWTAEATSDPMMVDVLWGDVPYNVGIACGGPAGLVVADLDCKNGKDGDARWNDLSRSLGAPETLTVETTTGGKHLFFAAPGEAAEIGNSVGRVAPGIDIRSDGGFVVAPGSVLDGKGEYRVIADVPIAAAPEWLLIRARKHTAVGEVAGPVAADSNDNIHAAIAWLYSGAKLAVEGDGGDATTFAVAARLKDLGVSPRRAFDLRLHPWNERCSPPWRPDDLAQKVRNAFSYGANAFGAATAEAQLPDYIPGIAPADAAPKPVETRAPITAEPEPAEAASVPARPWLIRGMAMIGQVTLLVAPGGAGKSTITFAAANAVCRVDGRFIGRAVEPKRCGAVWMANNEDPLTELHLRQRAFRAHWLEPVKAAFPLLFSSGQVRAFRVTQQIKLASGALIQKPLDVDAAVEFMRANGVKMFIVDPFVETHDADENDNAAMAAVAAQYRTIAQRAGAAVVLVHHTRKAQAASSEGHAGEMDSARGAGSVANVARIGLTLYGMSEKDAKRYGVPPDRRHRFVRLDDAKANLTLTSGEPRWFEKVSVDVPAIDEDGTRVNEPVGVLVPVADIRTAAPGRPLAEDVLAVMRDETEVEQAEVGRRLVGLDAVVYGSEAQVRKRLERLFDDGAVAVGQETITRETDGPGKRAKIVRRVADVFDDEKFSVSDL